VRVHYNLLHKNFLKLQFKAFCVSDFIKAFVTTSPNPSIALKGAGSKRTLLFFAPQCF
jgi:hypothetical protein